MSRLAKKPIPIPQGVNISVSGNSFRVEGPLGKLEQRFLPQYVHLKVDNENRQVWVERKANSKTFRATQGLFWALIRNAINGVSAGYSKQLEIKGGGYKWEMQGNTLVIRAGFSHPVNFPVPDGVKIKVENPSLITISGIDKQLIGQVAANIRFVRPPDPYKGKGIRYKDEVIKLKVGKSSGK